MRRHLLRRTGNAGPTFISYFIIFIFQDKTANQQIGLPNSLEASEAAAAVHHETGETKERIIGATSGHR